jgi:hypothetical protein
VIDNHYGQGYRDGPRFCTCRDCPIHGEPADPLPPSPQPALRRLKARGG